MEKTSISSFQWLEDLHDGGEDLAQPEVADRVDAARSNGESDQKCVANPYIVVRHVCA